MNRFITFSGLALAACALQACHAPNESKNATVLDQCLRVVLAQQCLQLLPKGPTSTGTSSDWDEVVGQCDSIAQYQAMRPASAVSANCAVSQ